ncbi:hypothetical protein [Mycolicibacterium sphagni]|jgi:hypothetical protein|uniref:Secreted protein n=1 Tax=Mycolicibacterium sphagni TaxID=1786 RepID=A0A255DRY1_9MYCO|nr:hypothetical protein [Mycolicibacterium sphagni]MCV7177971.1 hypothetical protein [Mycolicibacterium sphagni]OYN78393.1 hypothetical protein CG716_15375 [Mycolicibacterium sphagni]
MLREFVIAAAVAGTALSAAPVAAADEPHGPFPGDPPGMSYDAYLNAPCYRWDRFVFGRGPGGEPLACHWIPGQSPIGMDRPPEDVGFWVLSPKIYGVQAVGAPCPGSQAAAQSPDGLPMLCLGAQGWQPGSMHSGDWGNGNDFYPAS